MDTQKFIALYENNYDSLKPISPVNEWPADRVSGLSGFLAPSVQHPEMPLVSFEVRVERTWRSLWIEKQLPVLTFGNGRHRVRYLQYAGAPCFPVEVRAAGASLLAEWCGV
ncbi:plasmid fertility inhibition factor family protein [Xanthomonas sacchari]|uniref:plasmid fertility inhibition factor family protein n=1 Tax=Xanthomonas sacchari TaxID=56458 RepID=UPI00225B2DAB|nr:hypothetical protein [Xanthomonas sacchari]